MSYATNVGVVLELLNLIILEGSSKTIEGLGVGVIGISLDGRNSAVNRSSPDTALHLDDVLAIDKLDATRSDDRSGLSSSRD